jgi:nucleoside-diphosphate-sugar epimerase
MNDVLIAGCGYVGGELARRLVRRGARVWALRRSDAPVPAGAEPVRADLADPSALRSLPAEPDAVVYALSAGSSTEAAYRAAYVDGLVNLLAALRRAGASPSRLVYVSSTGVYGQSAGEWVDETSPTEPSGFTGRILLQGEETARTSGVPSVVLRLGGIYGPGRTRLIDAARAGTARRPARPRYTNRIHRDDAAGALEHLLGLERPEPVYLGVDGDPAEAGEVYAWLAARLGIAAPPVERAGSGLSGGAGARAPYTAGAGKRCRNDCLVASGYVFRYPSFREGYAALLAGTT